MALSLYDISIPVMISGVRTTNSILRHGQTFAKASGIEETSLVGRRLWPDMMPLSGQIQRASDTARFAAVRVGLPRSVAMPDTETSFEALEQRIAATIAYLQEVDPAGFEGRESEEVVLSAPGGNRLYSGRSYMLEFALPNFWFHVTTAYDLLRAAGVPVGRRNFLGWE